MKKCAWIYKEQWTKEIGQLKKVQGDTLQGVTPDKGDGDEQKRSYFLKEK